MNKLRCFLLAALFVLAPCAAEFAFACLCLLGKPACASFSEADAVFAGKVISISTYDEDKTNDRMRKVRFSVKEAFRGVEGKEIELNTLITDCEYEFKKGKTYLVYAYDNSVGGFATSHCSRTTELKNAAEDLAFARNKAAQKINEQSITGRIFDDFESYKPYSGIEVVVKGNGKIYSTASDEDGFFKIPISNPSKYAVNLLIPKDFVVSYYPIGKTRKMPGVRETNTHFVVEHDVEVKEGDCVYIPTGLFKTKKTT